jgi:hypothetical protein
MYEAGFCLPPIIRLLPQEERATMLGKLLSGISVLSTVFFCAGFISGTQSTAGTVSGTVLDPSGAVISNAVVLIKNSMSGYQQTAATDDHGTFAFRNVPPNPYRIEVTAAGFATYHQDVTVRASVPIELNISMTLAGTSLAVVVQGGDSQNLENVPYAHSDLYGAAINKLPILSANSGLSDVITLSAPGVVADSNGFFHPLGDHAQATFSLDGQPISDQQNKLFSTQIPLNAIQSMELVTGAPSAEFGGKTSLVVDAVTQSGLGKRPFGSLALRYGSFGTVGEEASLGWGNERFGNFLVANTERSGRFLDTPEYQPMHAVGNNGTFLDHFDFQPGTRDVFHMNVMAARNWFQIPNTYDQLSQDQRQKVITFDVAPGYQHTFSPTTLLSVTSFFRQDQVAYYPSRDPFADTPATLAQTRRLTNYGLKADLSYVHGHHNVKIGTQLMQTRLREEFSLGITDPDFNPVCVDDLGIAQALPGVTNPGQCAALGLRANPGLQPGLIPYDLTRGGRRFNFNGAANVNEYAFYAQDSITSGNLILSPGIRVDHYVGLSKATAVEPRVGVSYMVNQTGTVLRAAYSRTLETPYNENLIVSSTTGAGGLATNVFGAFGSQSLMPGRRNQYNAGLQQSLGRFLMFDGEYFWKRTDNAYDFDTLFNTPIHFPISWRRSKIDGFAARLSTVEIRGFQAFATLGHARARFFGPEVGGLIFNSPIDSGVFRIDHDQAFQQTTNLRYQRPKNTEWFALTWRYDSGEVAGAVTSLADALALTPAEQAAIGLYCGSQFATVASPITSCSSLYGATRLRIPAPGTYDADLNPARVAPRHLLNIGVGTDNLFHVGNEKRAAVQFSIVNVTNRVALYNFLSTFSGTHFVAPRSYEIELKYIF